MRSSYVQLIAAYTGTALAGLTEVGCRNAYYFYLGNVLTFHASAGTTYFLQLAGMFGDGGPLQFTLDVAPAPVAGFYFYPTDPSIFDTVQFYDSSSDPGGVNFQSFTWNFGDGASATDASPAHRYAADGDYTVTHTATTVDGRTSAPASQRVHVQTHDVAITKFSAPTAARAGQTRQISVGVNSKRYPENVQVSLLKSLPGNCFPVGCFEVVGSLTQSVPVRPSNRTTDFNFSYTFTSDDAAIGKVTFATTASIVNARDALPADNQALSSPTKVSR
jgi:PKD repeat protein